MVVWLALPEVIRYDKIGEKNKFCEKSLFNSFDISKNNPEIFFTSSKKQKRSILACLGMPGVGGKVVKGAFWPILECQNRWEMEKTFWRPIKKQVK